MIGWFSLGGFAVRHFVNDGLNVFIRRYADAWWDSSPSIIRELTTPDVERATIVAGHQFLHTIRDILEQIADKPPTAPCERRLAIERVDPLPDGRVFLQFVIGGVEPFDLRRRLELARDDEGEWRILRGSEEAADAEICLWPTRPMGVGAH